MHFNCNIWYRVLSVVQYRQALSSWHSRHPVCLCLYLLRYYPYFSPLLLHERISYGVHSVGWTDEHDWRTSTHHQPQGPCVLCQLVWVIRIYSVIHALSQLYTHNVKYCLMGDHLLLIVFQACKEGFRNDSNNFRMETIYMYMMQRWKFLFLNMLSVEDKNI